MLKLRSDLHRPDPEAHVERGTRLNAGRWLCFECWNLSLRNIFDGLAQKGPERVNARDPANPVNWRHDGICAWRLPKFVIPQGLSRIVSVSSGSTPVLNITSLGNAESETQSQLGRNIITQLISLHHAARYCYVSGPPGR